MPFALRFLLLLRPSSALQMDEVKSVSAACGLKDGLQNEREKSCVFSEKLLNPSELQLSNGDSYLGWPW